jgi:hypothetical protein
MSIYQYLGWAETATTEEKEAHRVHEERLIVQEIMKPADMHVSDKGRDARAMPPRNELPVHLSSAQSGHSGTFLLSYCAAGNTDWAIGPSNKSTAVDRFNVSVLELEVVSTCSISHYLLHEQSDEKVGV